MHLLQANALSRAFRERHEPFLQILPLLAEPALREEFARRGEDGWIFVDLQHASHDGGLMRFQLVWISTVSQIWRIGREPRLPTTLTGSPSSQHIMLLCLPSSVIHEANLSIRNSALI